MSFSIKDSGNYTMLINSKVYSAILATLFLKEKLGPIGIIGCLLSLIGAVIIVLHAPEDPEVASVEELVNYMLQPGILYFFFYFYLL